MLPPYIALDTINSVVPTVDDIVSTEFQTHWRLENSVISPDLHFHLNPALRDVFAGFPANERRVGRVRMRYVPCAFAASEDLLEGITNQRWNGRYGFEIYRDMIQGQKETARPLNVRVIEPSRAPPTDNGLRDL